MSIAIASRVRNEMCYIQICIDEYENQEIRGRLYNAYYEEAILFGSSMDMIRKLDEIFDKFGYPHATMNIRRFEIERPVKEEETRLQKQKILRAQEKEATKHNVKGKLATLRTRIMFRQNASWQGTVKWIEKDMDERFMSVLELLMIIDGICN